MSISTNTNDLDTTTSTIDKGEQTVLLAEYDIPGVSIGKNLKKRYRLQDIFDILLNATNQGYCDGGSSGEGSMTVCCIVNNFDEAKQVIEKALTGTKYGKFTRIVEENTAYWKELFPHQFVDKDVSSAQL